MNYFYKIKMRFSFLFQKNIILILFIILKVTKINSSTIIFDTRENLMKGSIAINSNGDMVIEYSTHSTEVYRLFYGVRKDGSGFFKGEYIKELYNLPGPRYESQNIFISLNNSDSSPQYLLSLGANRTVMELYKIDQYPYSSPDYVSKNTADIFGNSIFSYVNSLIDLKNENKEYLLVYIYEQKYILQKMAFSSLSLDGIGIKKAYTIPDDSSRIENRMIDGILFGNSSVIILFINNNNYYINAFDTELNNIYSKSLDTIDGYEDSVGLFAKSISLNDNFILFMYYKNINNNLKLKLINVQNSIEQLTIDLNQNSFKSDPLFNKLIKINSQRCAFFGFKISTFYELMNGEWPYGQISNSLTILLLDFYNEYKSLKIREYKIDYDNYKTHKEIDAAIYNGFICVSTSVYKVDEYKLYSMLMIFGYFNETKVLDMNFQKTK